MQNKSYFVLWAGLFSVLTSFAAFATPFGPIPHEKLVRFDAYLASPELDEIRLTHLRSMRDMRFPACTEEPIFERIPPSVALDDEFAWKAYALGAFRDTAPAPHIAIWYESYRTTYCGHQMRENTTLGILQEGAEPGISWDPPGDTVHNIVATSGPDIVGRIEVFSLGVLASRSDTTCSDEFSGITGITNTILPEPLDLSGNTWSERWFVSHCGLSTELAVTIQMQGQFDYGLAIEEIGTGIELPRIAAERSEESRAERRQRRRDRLNRNDPYRREND